MTASGRKMFNEFSNKRIRLRPAAVGGHPASRPGLSPRPSCGRMILVKRLIPILATSCALLLQACVSVKSTAVFYTPSTNAVYPPKPKGTVIPVMSQPPSRPYAEIGRFSFQSDLGYPFMMRAIQYNASRAGADGVIIKESKSWTLPYLYTVPPTLNWIPVGGGWYGGRCGGWYGGGMTAVPVWYPGYSGVSYDTFTGIDARMIIFR